MPKKHLAVSLRKPQPANFDAFVSDPEAAAAASATQPLSAAPDPIVRHGAREYRELTVYLPKELAQRLSFFCMDSQRELNGVIADAVHSYVDPAEARNGTTQGLPNAATLGASLLAFSRESLRALRALGSRFSL